MHGQCLNIFEKAFQNQLNWFPNFTAFFFTFLFPLSVTFLVFSLSLLFNRSANASLSSRSFRLSFSSSSSSSEDDEDDVFFLDLLLWIGSGSLSLLLSCLFCLICCLLLPLSFFLSYVKAKRIYSVKIWLQLGLSVVFMYQRRVCNLHADTYVPASPSLRRNQRFLWQKARWKQVLFILSHI